MWHKSWPLFFAHASILEVACPIKIPILSWCLSISGSQNYGSCIVYQESCHRPMSKTHVKHLVKSISIEYCHSFGVTQELKNTGFQLALSWWQSIVVKLEHVTRSRSNYGTPSKFIINTTLPSMCLIRDWYHACTVIREEPKGLFSKHDQPACQIWYRHGPPHHGPCARHFFTMLSLSHIHSVCDMFRCTQYSLYSL